MADDPSERGDGRKHDNTPKRDKGKGRAIDPPTPARRSNRLVLGFVAPNPRRSSLISRGDRDPLPPA